ncbi:MAG: hypothetical protein ACRD04_01805 [Terriglobales bacterium]
MAYGNAAHAYETLGRLDEAKAILNAALAHHTGGFEVHEYLATLAWRQGDTAEQARQTALASAAPQGRLDMLGDEAEIAAAYGQLTRARSLGAQALVLAQQLGEGKTIAVNNEELEGLAAALFGQSALARQAAAALAASTRPMALAYAAEIDARIGDTTAASTLMSKTVHQMPGSVWMRYVYPSIISAIGAIRAGHDAQAVAAMVAAAPYDGAVADSLYQRGAAYLAAGNGAAAAPAFQHLLQLRGVSFNAVGIGGAEFMPLAQLGLARAYALQRQTAPARTAYQDFFASWQNADPNLPVLQQARSEYARLPR